MVSKLRNCWPGGVASLIKATCESKKGPRWSAKAFAWCTGAGERKASESEYLVLSKRGRARTGGGWMGWRVYSKTTQAGRQSVRVYSPSVFAAHQISFMDLTTGPREGRVNALQPRPPLHHCLQNRQRPPSYVRGSPSRALFSSSLSRARTRVHNLIRRRGSISKKRSRWWAAFYTVDCFYCNLRERNTQRTGHNCSRRPIIYCRAGRKKVTLLGRTHAHPGGT